LRKEWGMKSYDINGYVVTCDNHGYRIRFYTAPFGYIGSYFKATKKAGYSKPFSPDLDWVADVKGPKSAATLCLKVALNKLS
jgi:hypothetical protein